MNSTRCSRLPLAVTCPASQIPPRIRIEAPAPQADLGSAVHWLMAAEIAGTPGTVEQAVENFNVPIDELTALLAMTRRCWESIRQWFPEPQVEVALDPRLADPTKEHGIGHVTLNGHVDLLSFAGTEARIADWKTGRIDADAEQQMRGYAFLASILYDADSVRACLVRVREGTAEWFHWTAGELLAWYAHTLSRLSQTDAYNPGPHCRYCPRFLECQAVSQWMNVAANTICGTALGRGPYDSPGLLYDYLRTLETACAAVRDGLRIYTEKAGGQLDLEDGRMLVLTQQRRREIDYTAAAGTLTEFLGPETVRGLIRIGKGDVENALKTTAPRGQKGKHVATFFECLEHLGALRTTYTERLEIKRVSNTSSNDKSTGQSDQQPAVITGAQQGPD